MFKLIPEPWTVLKHAFSVWIMVVCIGLIWLEGPLTTLVQYYAGEGLLSQLAAQAVTSTLMVAAIYARVVAQDRLQERVTAAKIKRQVRARHGES
ncbi:hypothetical protein EV128_12250 [Rhizobium azibense]|nr:hypothetical protein EV128_12250 [Rhizobium azibense]